MLSEARPLLGGHHVSWCQISCRRCDDDHSAYRGGPTQYWGASVRGLTTCWIGKSSKWLPPYTANYGCDCLRKVDLGTGSRGNPKRPLPSRRARQPVERFLSGTSRPSRLIHTPPGVAANPFLGVAITGAGRRLEQGGFSRAPQYATPFAPRPQRPGFSLPSHSTRS
jgi:hypothetical protein